MADPRDHWEGVYATKAETAVSWYQPQAALSLDLIEGVGAPASVIDIGGGASTLVDGLLARGIGDVTVLDIAEGALTRSRLRLGDAAAKVSWLVADIAHWTPPRTWDVWHDRAVFHFLTDRQRQDAYVAALVRGTHVGSTVIVATFALDGPEKCSGLPVQRYDAAGIARRLGPAFSLTRHVEERHATPWGAEQHFVYAVLVRR